MAVPSPLSSPRGRGSTAAAGWRNADDLRWAVRHWAARIGVHPPQVHVRTMRHKWASISTSGRLTLNAELIALPASLGEYVVVHELLHLLAPNHGRVHKSFLLAYLPDWEVRQEQLAAYGVREARAGEARTQRRRVS